MADKTIHPNAVKDPQDWVTGDEPMTGPQESYLNTLAREAHADVPDDLTKAEASEKIEELQEQTGRGPNAPAGRRLPDPLGPREQAAPKASVVA